MNIENIMIRQTSITIIKTEYMRILKQTDTYIYKQLYTPH